MFPASSAAHYRLLFFLSLLGCFLGPHQGSTLSLQHGRTLELPGLGAGAEKESERPTHGPLAAGSGLGGPSRKARRPLAPRVAESLVLSQALLS